MAKMKPDQFVEAYTACGAETHGQAANMLGISRRSIVRYTQGDLPIPVIVRRLLQMIKAHGLPRHWHDEA